MALEDILLRITAHSPMIAPKGSDLTYAELDNNFIILYDWIKAMGAGGNLSPYNAGTTYENTPPTYVSYSGNIWQFINGTPTSGITPGTNPAYWEQVTIGSLTHVQNTDQYIDLGGVSQASALEIYNSIHPLVKTVAQMQALLGAYVPGQRYIVTDPGSGQFDAGGIVMVTAIASNFLEMRCIGRLKNAAMGALMTFECEYDVQSDHFSKVREPISQQEITELTNGGLAAWPFDQATIAMVKAEDPSVIGIDTASTIFYCNFGPVTTLNLQNGSTIERVNTGSFASIAMGSTSACSLSGSTLEADAILTMVDDHHFTDILLGAGKTINLTTVATGYTQTKVSYTDAGSTFVCDVAIDLNALTTLDITTVVGAEDYSFCGIFTNLISTGANVAIDLLTTNLNDHAYTFYWNDPAQTITWVHATNNLYLNGSANIVLNTQGDYQKLSYNSILTGWNSGETFKQ